MGVESTEFKPQAEGAVEEFEGDVVVPSELPNSDGWEQESHDDREQSSKKVTDTAAEAALRLFEYEVVEPMMLDQAMYDAEGEGEAKTMGLSLRITDAKERFGFKPSTHEELNHLRGLTTTDHIRGAATHLSQIQRHNVTENKKAVEATKDLSEDERVKIDPTLPRRTVERIIADYRSYVETAVSQRGLLLNLQTILSNRYKRSERASSVSVLKDWTMDASTSVPIKALIKSQAIEAYLVDDTDAKSPLQIDFSKLTSGEVRSLGDAYIEGLKVGQLQDQIASLAREQQSRFIFWTDALKESLPNNAARDSAIAALKAFKLL